jgi:hypothetical protein
MSSIVNDFFEKTFVLNMSSEHQNIPVIERRMKHVNIDYAIFNAVNGKASKFDKFWELYNGRPVSTDLEKSYKKKFIESRGAFGYLKTMERLLGDAIKNKYDSILVFDNDCLFDLDFETKAKKWLQQINKDKWKVLLFGASDYGLSSFSPSSPHYTPVKLKTCGSFALGIHNSVFKEVLNELSKMETPFDNLPLGNVYEKYTEQCFVAYPNIVIADVKYSSIRGARNLESHSKLMHWALANFNTNS